MPPRPSSPGPASEDSPPLVRGRAMPPLPSLPKQALAAPKSGEFDPQQEILKALAQMDQNRKAFEDQIREEVRAAVIAEVPRQVTASLPPPPEKKRWSKPDMSWIGHLPAILMAIGALIGVVAQSCSTSEKKYGAVVERVDKIEKKLDAHVTVSDLDQIAEKTKEDKIRTYLLKERDWVGGVFEKQGVKVDDPPGSPARAEIEFYPAPQRGSKAPLIQPKATFPSPPEL